ncbi:MAG: hypothetical protein Q4P09_05350 [Phascolarctobacterium sp.]|nr:hypothetical protein [Phascolarctobacterium sp.]
MKKAYIMLEIGIIGVGGGQMYTRNKVCFMREKEWDVFVFSGLEGKVIISELIDQIPFIIPELISAPMVYSKKTIKEVINRVLTQVKGYDEYIIESGSAHLAYWGELLAERLRCKNMVHLLDERNDLLVPLDYLDFYKFKLERRELSGIIKSSLPQLFRNAPFIKDNNSYYLSSVCQNVIDEHIEESFSIPQCDFSLCCIGRLEKPYVSEVAKAFKQVVMNNREKSFAIVFIGDSINRANRDRIVDLLSIERNVKLIMPGFVLPIPRSFFEKIDLFVSSAGSAGVSYRMNRPTISIDSEDLKAIGVMGYDTLNSIKRDNEPPQDIAQFIMKVLEGGYLNNFVYRPCSYEPNIGTLCSHLDFYNQSSKNLEYFPIKKLKPAGKDKKKYIIRKLLGKELYLLLRPFYSKLISKG